MTMCCVLLLGCLAFPGDKELAELKPEDLRLPAEDGVQVAADYYAPKKGDGNRAPVVILIHMYPEDRKSWKPLLPLLHDAGFAVLAYDIRGRGGSVNPESMQLRQRYGKHDPVMFNDAWRDTDAAKKWLAKRDECDAGRTVIIGASIGASIALDYARRDKDVKAIVLLSPGTNYMSVNSIVHIAECADRPIQILVPEKEWKMIQPLVEASRDRAKAEQYPGSRAFHGTNLLTCPSGEHVRQSIMNFILPAVGMRAASQPSEAAVKKP